MSTVKIREDRLQVVQQKRDRLPPPLKPRRWGADGETWARQMPLISATTTRSSPALFDAHHVTINDAIINAGTARQASFEIAIQQKEHGSFRWIVCAPASPRFYKGDFTRFLVENLRRPRGGLPERRLYIHGYIGGSASPGSHPAVDDPGLDRHALPRGKTNAAYHRP